ncbi:MAG: ATP-binding cassette domain-containing protein [Dehalococcoidia bacterium]|nr:ATP-binding cassette domain-containing protein [Dehalococcoidia bacterium]
MSNSNSVVEADNLSKKFNDFLAVDHINLDIKRGEIFGFLGPNGAGKTTTTKMLSTILKPTSGSINICGYDVSRQKAQVRGCIAVVFQDPCIDTFLTGRENLDFHARMYHMNGKQRLKRISEVLDLLNLKGQEHIKMSDCSGGVQRRFEVARGFMTHPRVLFLDEPTLGMDIQARRKLWEYIKMLNQQENISIVLTTHYIEEADFLCHRVAMMNQGRVVAVDTPDNLKAAVGMDQVSLRVSGGAGHQFAAVLRGVEGSEKVEESNGLVQLSIKNGEDRLAGLVELADEYGFVLSDVDLHQPSLEAAFLYYTGRILNNESANMAKSSMDTGKGMK